MKCFFWICRFRSETGSTEVDSGIKRPESTPIPTVIVSGDSADEQPEEKEHDRDSDTGSVYDGSIYGADSHHEDSTEDLASKGHLDLQLK